MRIVLILLLVLYAVKAHSAENYVLFIDTNNSPLELKAAREAAEKSGRKLLVLPDISEKDRKAYLQMSGQANALSRRRDKACEGNDEKACDEAGKKYDEVDLEKSKLLETFQLSNEKLTAFLAANQEKSVSSVVISGHDGTGSFSGEFGSISDAQLAKELEKYPAMKDSIRTLHLWGCYTTSPGSLLLNWKKHFPNISLITGYEGRAPLADKPAGWHYLKGVLAQEPALLRAGDSAKLQKLLKKIPGANQVTAGILACGEYATNKESYSLSDLQHRCEDMKPQIQERGPEFECYMKGSEEKCANPPEDIARGSVRQFYELLHKTAACGAINTDPLFRTYSRDSAIRLVFGREVQKNFEKIYAPLLAEIDETLAKMGAPERLRFKNVGSLSRREMLQRADELLAFLEKQKHDPLLDPAQLKITERDAQVASLRQFQQYFTSVMTDLPVHCVPFNWTEPNQKEKSSCMDERWTGNAGTKVFLDPNNGLRNTLLSGMSYEVSGQAEELRKSSGKKLDAVTQAKLQALDTQAEKLRYHALYGSDAMPPAYLKRIALREEYAKLAREFAEKGMKHLTSDPAAMKLVLEINQPDTESSVKSYEENIRQTEESLKTLPAEEEKERPLYEKNLRYQRERLQIEKAVLEAAKLLRSEGDWSDHKAELINELEDAIGRRRRELDIESKSGEAESYRQYLKATDLPAEYKELYTKRLKGLETDLSEAQSESAADMRRRGHDYLFQVRGKNN